MKDFMQMVYGFTAQIALCAVGLLVMAIVGLVSGVLTVAKFTAAWAILFGY